MNFYQINITDSDTEFPKIISESFSFSNETSNIVYSKIKPHLKRLDERIQLLIESDYVDKVYRDSYYNYYSTKLAPYNRNCIKVSLFSPDANLKSKNLWEENNIKELQNKHFLGFFVIRPTLPNILGRSVISPNALLYNNFKICKAEFATTAHGIKFKTLGFPHSSQDKETITCAETTLWSIMEYFGHKYPEYKTILPSSISKILKFLSTERQYPSQGLPISEISFVLKKVGFGTKMYAYSSFNSDDFFSIVSCYVESGIPIVVAMRNKNIKDNSGIAHAVLCIGYEDFDKNEIHNIKPKKFGDSYTYYDYHDLNRQFIFVDDNHPTYIKAPLRKPAINYSDDYNSESWLGCTISHIVVPLYPKIYLDAYTANWFINCLLFESDYPVKRSDKTLLRTFLASSRSYKHYIASCNELGFDVKEFILKQDLPKFIWVSEISTPELAVKEKVNGLVILDATEVNTENYEVLVFALYSDYCIVLDDKRASLMDINKINENKSITLPSFKKFDTNLQ